MAEPEIEYESDPEEAKLSLKMRRREASDDEGEEGENHREKPLRRADDSEGESEGAPAEYEDELEEGEEEYDLVEYLEEEVDYEESGGVVGMAAVERVVGVAEGEEGLAVGATSRLGAEEKMDVNYDAGEVYHGNSNVEDGGQGEDRKEMEPFAVPTAGAFYMHDDRFRDNARGRNRRMLGGRRLWESKDDRKWGHDKFEELTMQERHHEETRRGSRGRFRGRIRNRGVDRGYSPGNRLREYNDNYRDQSNNNQKNVYKGVRGRGPRRYQPSSKNSVDLPVAQKNQSGKPSEKPSYVKSGRTSQSVSNAESDVVQPKKHVASNLNIASPPFYPTGSSSKEVTASTVNRNGQQSMVSESFSVAQPTGAGRGKNVVDAIGMDKLYIDDSASGMAGKPRNSIPIPVSGSLSGNLTQPQSRNQGRGQNSFTQMTYQSGFSGNQVNRVPPASQPQSLQKFPGQGRAQFSVQASGQRLPGGPQASSPPKAANAVSEFESGETESASESNQMKTAVVSKGKGGAQGGGRGSFMYGGAQVIGASGGVSSGHSDQNFPAFLPVMQFGAQHPGGIGVPAVGMAFPGYVAPQQLGLGSSEMTWLPVLAGAAGALGATYCPPYITVDSAYNARPSGQASATTTTSSKETNAIKASNDWKLQNPDLAGDDVSQRQKNPRRYTEMKFDQ